VDAAKHSLVTTGLTRTFRGRRAVDDVSLTVREGDVYGFLGPHGAGKTTAIRCILGLMAPDAGRIEIFGQAASVATRAEVGALVETPAFHEWMTAADNLRVALDYRGRGNATDIDWALDRVGLLARAGDSVKTLSLGMRQRLGIARAILGRPKLLVLDEPTNGLDPRGMKDIRVLLQTLCKEEGITVFVSSHLLAEVELLCTRVGILERGRLVAEGTVKDLLAGVVGSAEVDVRARNRDRLVAVIPEIRGASQLPIEGEAVRLKLDGIDVPALNKALVAAGIEVEALTPVEGSLEELFLHLTTKEIS
jgi:ABC-2 type transport system ATP-binding protein